MIEKQDPLLLWYEKPAKAWQEALPLGNGRIGAMVYGDPAREIISLNEDSLWSGYPRDTNVPGAAGYFPEAADFAMKGEYRAAQEYIERHMLGEYTQSYLPMGDLHLDFPDMDGKRIEAYRRELDLKTAVSTVEFTVQGVTYRRECFVSAPGQAFVMRLSASEPGKINFSASLASQLRHETTVQGQTVTLRGICPAQADPSYVDSENPIRYGDTPETQGMSFITMLRAECEGGRAACRKDTLEITHADSVTLYLCAQTSFNGFDRHPQLEGKDFTRLCERDMAAACKNDYDRLKTAHIDDYRNLFDRLDISFGGDVPELPTDERLRQAVPQDVQLFALLFQYGRYLMIASSREGTAATNLQGIWNAEMRPPWSSNYTVNINTEMNYWPAEACGLPELHKPLFDLLKTVSVTGGKTAKAHYNAGGYVLHHNTDIWGLANPVGRGGAGIAAYAFWPMAAGWLSRHVFEHYEYAPDTAFLKDTAYPLIRGAAEFYLDVMREDEKGQLVFCPATSPENRFLIDGEDCAVAKTATMTTAIIRETLKNAVACCDILEMDPDFRQRLQKALDQLPPYEIGSKGQLLEWNGEFEEEDVHHRHVSHLYPLYPANDIDLLRTPELADGCKRVLELRGDESTGWAMAWRICLWARLGDGNHAYEVLRRQLNFVESGDVNYSGGGGSYANLFGAHPPFQIDSNFGTPAGICEMLLQNGPEGMRLLPALPDAFPDGHIKGIRAKNGFRVDIEWKGGRLLKAVLYKTGSTVACQDVFYRGKRCEIRLEAGERITLTEQDFA